MAREIKANAFAEADRIRNDIMAQNEKMMKELMGKLGLSSPVYRPGWKSGAEDGPKKIDVQWDSFSSMQLYSVRS